MSRWFLVVGSALLVSSLWLGCDNGTDEDGNAAVDAGGDGDVDSGAGGGGGGGECLNSADQAELGGLDMTEVSRTCSPGCKDAVDIPSCIAPCYANETNLSAECIDCYALLRGCIMVNCTMCSAGSDTNECVACREEHQCNSTFTACSGLVL